MRINLIAELYQAVFFLLFFSFLSLSHLKSYLRVAQGSPPHVQDGQVVIGPVARVVNEGLGHNIQADLVLPNLIIVISVHVFVHAVSTGMWEGGKGGREKD